MRALLARGDRVRCLVRPTSSLSNLEGLDVERVEGDLCRPSTLVAAVRGCRVVYHCAADYRLYARDSRQIYAANVDGTRALLQAARDEGVERVVYTSSVGALGLESDGSPATEITAVDLRGMIGWMLLVFFNVKIRKIEISFVRANFDFSMHTIDLFLKCRLLYKSHSKSVETHFWESVNFKLL